MFVERGEFRTPPAHLKHAQFHLFACHMLVFCQTAPLFALRMHVPGTQFEEKEPRFPEKHP